MREPDHPQLTHMIKIGTPVILSGLKKEKYNNKHGRICTLYNSAKGKYGVQLIDGETILAVRPTNISTSELNDDNMKVKGKNQNPYRNISEHASSTKAKQKTGHIHNKEKNVQKNKKQLTRKVKKNVPRKNIQREQKNKSLHADKSEHVPPMNANKRVNHIRNKEKNIQKNKGQETRKVPPSVSRKNTKISMLIKITNKDRIGIRKHPEYPGERTGVDVSLGQIFKCSQRKFYKYQNYKITFYKLSDGQGWIHNFRRRNPTALDGLKEIYSESIERNMKDLKVGTAVTLKGLKKAAKHNGKIGHICTLYNLDKERYGVRLDNGKILAIQPANITMLKEKAKNKSLNKIDNEPTAFPKAKKITRDNSKKRKTKMNNDEIHTKGEIISRRKDDKREKEKKKSTDKFENETASSKKQRKRDKPIEMRVEAKTKTDKLENETKLPKKTKIRDRRIQKKKKENVNNGEKKKKIGKKLLKNESIRKEKIESISQVEKKGTLSDKAKERVHRIREKIKTRKDNGQPKVKMGSKDTVKNERTSRQAKERDKHLQKKGTTHITNGEGKKQVKKHLSKITTKDTSTRINTLKIGAKVILKGLKNAKKYNGKDGHIITLYNPIKKKYGVQLVDDERILAVRPANIIVKE